MTLSQLFVNSWAKKEGITPTKDAFEWIDELNRIVLVDIHKTTLKTTGWFYDKNLGQIVNAKRSFFQIAGLRCGKIEQPIIIQDEIGYLGFLCKEIGGVLHFLTQAKIEPGNINKIQLSPTIQATRSNFTQQHGGAKPPYLSVFLNADKHTIIVDQIQSEQSSRFFKKRNRNIIVMLSSDADVEENPRYKWLTLGQIKQLMRIDNLVNMDARTVLSCIPFYKYSDALEDIADVSDPALARSVISGSQTEALPRIYRYINNYKMFNKEKPELIPLYSLQDWFYSKDEFKHKNKYPFKLIFCDITIDGREVKHWGQPLFEAQGKATFGLFTQVRNGVREFLVCARPEIGCMDLVELGPTVQIEASGIAQNDIEKQFLKLMQSKKNVLYDVILSEEGGRFYHEQNRNIIIEIDASKTSNPPAGYWWLTYHSLNKLTQINNILNIQLRNLLSLLEI
jgi:oxidase EvaA